MSLHFNVSDTNSTHAVRVKYTMAPPTPPGFRIDGSGISVMFVSGWQEEFGWHNAENVILSIFSNLLEYNICQSATCEIVKTTNDPVN